MFRYVQSLIFSSLVLPDDEVQTIFWWLVWFLAWPFQGWFQHCNGSRNHQYFLSLYTVCVLSFIYFTAVTNLILCWFWSTKHTHLLCTNVSWRWLQLLRTYPIKSLTLRQELWHSWQDQTSQYLEVSISEWLHCLESWSCGKFDVEDRSSVWGVNYQWFGKSCSWAAWDLVSLWRPHRS